VLSSGADELLKSLGTLGLVGPDELASARQKMEAEGTATAVDAATCLLKLGLITPFQSDRLLSGQSRECVLAGRYQIQDQIGAGGMGTVYRALDTNLERVVAIKVLPPTSVPDADAVTRFQREAKALAKLSHANIIQAFDSGADQGRHFLVMEFLEGGSLAGLLREQGRVPMTIAADYAYQAALGLEHAHARGLVHRDLKPSNLLLTRDGRVKILDLGLARFLQNQVGEATLTREGSAMGTPDYMPPEQFRDARHVDARSDIYSLGCTLYHLVAGQVPFPTSSLSEKYEAHEKRQPRDLDELCPELPAGLALVIGRMMSKHPADRFQSARETADALAPYVAGSSPSGRFLKATIIWQGSTPEFSVESVRARRRLRILRGSSLGAGFVIVALVSLWIGGLFRQPQTAIDGARNQLAPLGNEARKSTIASNADGNDDAASNAVPDPGDLNVLTVAQDGSGQFRTIGAALEQAKPGMTVRVLDEAVYAENVSIAKDALHRGLTLEAINRATISATQSRGAGVFIRSVPHVTVRGFRLRSDAPQSVLVGIKGAAAGLRLEDLQLQAGSASDYEGISFVGAELSDLDAPVVVQNCVLQSPQVGINVYAIDGDYQTPLPTSRVLIRGNRINNASGLAIALRGALKQVQVVGNIIDGAPQLAAIQLDKLLDGTSDVLIANNTIFDAATALRLWDSRVAGKNVELSNNLILGSKSPDMLFIDSGGSLLEMRGPGDGESVHRTWTLRCNWRETKPPKADEPMVKAWMPPASEDVLRDRIDVLSRDSANASFLRPAADSPLATGGAGKVDSTLPGYVGALAPDGVDSWDWQKTWDARHPKMLVTVSKDAKNGGEFRSIGEALASLSRPGMTVRVLDDAEYAETIVIENSPKYQRLTLESTARATIVAAASRVGVVIKSVPDVTLRGFNLKTAAQQGCMLVVVTGTSRGCVIENLKCTGNRDTYGVHVESLDVSTGEPPVQIRGCTISGLGTAIELVGKQLQSRQPLSIKGVVILGNRISDCVDRGIGLTGRVNDVAILENRVSSTGGGCITFEDLLSGSGQILIANNVLQHEQTCLQVSDPMVPMPDVSILNNLIFSDSGPDLAYSGSSPELLAGWKIANNYRQHSLPESPEERRRWLSATNDRIGQRVPPLSIDPTSTDFLVPPKSVDLSAISPSNDSPPYIGPEPPEGIERWDWNKSRKLVREKE
jgi:serine/threonine-protein kinase